MPATLLHHHRVVAPCRSRQATSARAIRPSSPTPTTTTIMQSVHGHRACALLYSRRQARAGDVWVTAWAWATALSPRVRQAPRGTSAATATRSVAPGCPKMRAWAWTHAHTRGCTQLRNSTHTRCTTQLTTPSWKAAPPMSASQAHMPTARDCVQLRCRARSSESRCLFCTCAD